MNEGGGNVAIGPNNPSTALEVNGRVTAIAFNPSRDRDLKEDFQLISPRAVLEKVVALPISQWNFKTDEARYLGLMNQDFHAAFGLGADDKHIATVDADGVALAAIQGLNEKVERRMKNAEASFQELRSENAELKQAVNEPRELVRVLN